MSTEEREAKHGEKTVLIKVRLWTDKIAEEAGNIVPKHAWDYGTVNLERNESHGIEPAKPIHFNSMDELLTKIEELLTREGIELHDA